MPNFASGPGGINLEDGFLRETDIIDRYVGNRLWIWGNGLNGVLGDNQATVSRSSPIQTVAGGTNWSSVNAGYLHSAAIKTDGSLWLWGSGSDGALGTNASTTRSSPVQTVSTGTNWKLVGKGSSRHTAVIKTDGTLWLWGRNLQGQLGDNSSIAKSSPVQTVSTGTNWKLVSAGLYHTIAIKTDGTLWTWGINTEGQLGDTTRTSRSSPVQTVSTGTNWKQIGVGRLHTGAIKTDGTLWTWGLNSNGQLGDNSVTHRSSPIQTIAGGTNWKQIAGGFQNSIAIKTDGTLWTWGAGGSGQLGTNNITNRSSPVQTISGGTNWKLVTSGGYHVAAIKTDGTLWTWGRNIEGQLGTNTTPSRSSPVQTVTGGDNWKEVSAGDTHTAAITFQES